MIQLLLRNQWKMAINTLRTQRKVNYLSYLIVAVVLGALLYFLSRSVWKMGSMITEPVLAGLVSYGSLAAIGFIILLGVPQVFKSLYAATDLNLLFTMPIKTRHIFWVKYIQSFIGIPLLLFILFLIPLYLYGILMSAHFLYYAVALLALLSVLIIGLSIAYLFNLALIQLIPANRANEFMTMMSFLSGILVYLMFMLPTYLDDQPLSDKLLQGLPLFPEWVPVTWVSDALVTSISGSAGFIVPLAMTVALAIIFMLITFMLVEKGFRTGWIKLSEGTSTKKKKKKISASKLKAPTLHHPIIAVGKKEFYAIKRDMREWLIFMPIIFFIVFGVIGALSGGAKLSDLQGPNQITWPIAQGILLFVYAMFNGQIASSSIAREGKSIWILRILPLSGRDIALGKLWISWLIPFIILTIIEIIVAIFLKWSLLPFIGGVAMKMVITLGISGIGLWLGTIGAKHNPNNPQQRLKFSTSLILLLASYIYLIIALIPYILLILPTDILDPLQDASVTGFWGGVLNIVMALLSWKAAHPIIVWIVGVVIMLVFSLGVTYLFTILSGRKIDKGVEIEIVRNTSSASFSKKSGKFF
ncbi:putative ABC transporter permease subunit [Aquibacillus kalidii]|uniref:putative ABC transporter permease subunit n=1 Tax=Aquibacillus kalidii TaxID=2762597 RepID=UPI0016476F56|nr:hypothetical protein [Aquibacillus kalidii]